MSEAVIRATDSDDDARRPDLPPFGLAALVLPCPEIRESITWPGRNSRLIVVALAARQPVDLRSEEFLVFLRHF